MVRILLIIIILFLGIGTEDRAFSQGCTINATSLNFGNYNPLSPASLDAVGTLTINCVRTVSAEVKLSVSSSSGTFTPRRMRRSGGDDLLDYNIFIDPGRTRIFGDGTGGTEFQKVRKPPGTPAHEPWSSQITLYGRIPSGQDVSMGTYSDTLSATVTP